MASLNKVQLIGNLGKDPEALNLPSGQPGAKLSVATEESWNDQAGQRQSETTWHRVVLFGQPAQYALTYLRKGSQAYVEGRLRVRSYKDKNTQEDKQSVEVVASKIMGLGSNRPAEAVSTPATNKDQPASTVVAEGASSEEDYPF